MTAPEKHNEMQALNWISDFGWIRVSELGLLLFKGSNTRKQAERLIRLLKKRDLILERVLPGRAGRAVVLAAKGVRFLRDDGIFAQSGKDLGCIRNGVWLPPKTWRHDLLAQSVLCTLYKLGYEIIPENQIRRQAGRTRKIPDGLAKKPGGQWCWLEVESTRKSGPHMHRLAAALLAVTTGTVDICGIHPQGCFVAYYSDSKDERSNKLNHKQRISNAIAATADSETKVTFVKCARNSSASLTGIEFIETKIESQKTTKVLACLNANGWIFDEQTGLLSANYGSFIAYVWQDTDTPGTWSFDARSNEFSGFAGYAQSLHEAKRCAAALIAAA